ncbi:DUF885 domain-containing protein [Cellulomonas composti]|uniref:DUF885 domain-containing protein n=1 Tax=Cellulomonas composti TaxID=266130 RepID=A0A511JCC7_9CELL|nr:DUF885 domain-containing protein [Cellulomonas composti]GEL95648.1 hypothetical protein CCO02nite_23060 [Cellulomonas composti]
MTTREPTALDAVAEKHLQAFAALDPITATSIGLSGYDHLMTDLSPVGHQARQDLSAATLRALDEVPVVDEVDTLTAAAMRERLGLELELFEAGEHLRDLNNIASPVQGLRDVFDIMATGDVEAWENIAARLVALPDSVEGYIESLRAGAARGLVPAVRQVVEGANQAADLAGDESFFTAFVHSEATAALDDSAACQRVRAELERGAADARAAYGRLTEFLRDELAPQAPAQDAAGRDRYALYSRAFLGATIDLEETYAWGVEELARVVAEQESVAAKIAGPGASVEDAVAALDADPSRTLTGTDALRRWMQETSDSAIAALHGTHFDIPEPLHTLECRIAPTQNGGIYYTGPSDDFTRPGRMWWSVPPDVTTFNTWRERTTVYHEGVPGHHLQVGQAVFARDTLNSWRRLACWTSGHGEGWALYAERLMADLGFLDDPGDRLGMLDGQRMRAARVVFDIGVHLGLPAPEQWGGGTWDADKAFEFLKANVNMPESFVRFEWMRYLGWPGQAPSYKVGQRLWEQTRDAARDAAGADFDLRAFHAKALNLGSLPLDVLKLAF